MTAKTTASETLDREFFEIRHRLLDVAAALDRVQRGRSPESLAADPRPAKIRDAITILLDQRDDRAERVLMVFSDPYDETWRARR